MHHSGLEVRRRSRDDCRGQRRYWERSGARGQGVGPVATTGGREGIVVDKTAAVLERVAGAREVALAVIDGTGVAEAAGAVAGLVEDAGVLVVGAACHASLDVHIREVGNQRPRLEPVLGPEASQVRVAVDDAGVCPDSGRARR